MIVRIFGENRLGGILGMLFFQALIYTSGYFAGTETSAETPLPVFNALDRFTADFPLIGFSISFTVVFLTALMINYLLIQLNLFSRPTYLPGFFFLLFFTAFPANLVINDTVIATFCCVLIWMFLNPGVDGTLHSMRVFNAALVAGILSVFYYPAIYWILFIPVALTIFNVFSVRKMIISFTGFLIPWVYAFTYVYWFDLLENQLNPETFLAFRIPDIPFSTNREVSVLISFIVGSIIVGWTLIHYVAGIFKLKLLQRRRYTLLIFCSMMVMTTAFHTTAPFPGHLYIISFFASVFCARYFLLSKRWWVDDLMVGSFVLLVFINHWVKYLA